MYIPLENPDSVNVGCIHVFFLVNSPSDSYAHQILNSIVLECNN